MARILVTDDDSNILSLIQSILLEERYEVFTSTCGKKTLQNLGKYQPDLLIVDLVMPEMNGLELIEKIRTDELYQTIPVLVLTAYKDDDKLVEAFNAGADDFLSKPFIASELLVRVRAHLRVSQSFKSLGLKMREIEKFKQMRNDFTQMLVHDMKNPLAAIHGNLELLAITDPGDKSRHERLVRILKHSSSQLSDLIANILDLESAEQKGFALEKKSLNLPALIEEVLQEQRSFPYGAEIPVVTDISGNLPEVQADRSLIRRVLSNLLSNAVKYSPTGKKVVVRVQSDQNGVTVQVTNEGPGIPAEFHQRIFEKFGTLQARQEGIQSSTGLGLPFCKLAIESHGGKIGLKSEQGSGNTFFFTLPVER